MDFSKPAPSYAADFEQVKERIAYTNELFQWCLRRAKKAYSLGRLKDAMVWCDLAARALSTSCSPLVSEELENLLLAIAGCLPVPEWKRTKDAAAPRRWLHVLDRAVHNGGHAMTVSRWILADPASLHNIALPYQDLPVPGILTDVIQHTDGKIFMPEPGIDLLSRAQWLRNLAFANADYVVLHIANHSAVSPAAFGVNGGPPVLFNNHAAHVFWTGAPVIDLVINSRGSALEIQWTEELRAIPRCATLPMPINPPQTETAEGDPFTPEFRAESRRVLGIPARATVLLTVGRDPKYNPIPGIDFIEVARSILAARPDTYLLVVGTTDERWKSASRATQGRLIPTGIQHDLSMYHAAADVYMEGFPFGSTTALLEAGMHHVPCVLAPAECPPPFTTDGVAVDNELQRPATIEEYKKAILDLAGDVAERRRRGRSLGRSIRAHHSGAGWFRYLAAILRNLPQSHAVHPVRPPQAPPKEIEYFWETYMLRVESNVLPFLLEVALRAGVRPSMDMRFYRAYWKAASLRRREGRLQFFLMALSSLLFPLCPSSARLSLLRRVGSLAQNNGLMLKVLHPMRSVKRLAVQFAGAKA